MPNSPHQKYCVGPAAWHSWWSVAEALTSSITPTACSHEDHGSGDWKLCGEDKEVLEHRLM